MNQPRPVVYYTELLRRADEIRTALGELMHPDTDAYAHDGQGNEWPVLVLGTDWQTKLLFWRPRDLAQLDQAPGGRALLGGTQAVEMHAARSDGSRVQLHLGRPQVVRFSDDSLAMVSDFPAELRLDTPYAAAGN
ncbi:hypothetical protein CEG14_08535 [Bordetella genomosp. 1]|uniref:Uncharacterized protein n=1 Tax=Bordetella genomosp. 1 TaxID=1395607 RepID=A0A261SCS3_9BORD|nr:hypothetical protein [Bordetella genomosp. 1]OZI35146.1 hypothetical protein CEG14_08535 [Bordetella genomosp. 1]OZI63686.1 hypothetical protein CAL27_13840 [Bordetella genomosp. 1]